jgi:hypothetical protein
VSQDEQQPARTVGDERRLHLATRHLLIALLPLAVIIVSDWLINEYGWPSPSRLKLEANVSGHAESAARVRVVTMLLLLAGASICAFVYFIRQALRFDTESRIKLAAAFVALVLAAILYFQSSPANPPVQAQELTDQSLFCAAASHPGQMALKQPALAVVHGRRAKAAEAAPENCQAANYASLRRLIFLQQVALALAIPAMVFGAILALGRWGRRSRVSAGEPDATAAGSPSLDGDAGGDLPFFDPALLQAQINRLNMILYLSAFLLVSGLMFISAYHHYPAFGLAEASAKLYGNHAKAVVLFYAVSFSLLILTFYLPSATTLARRAARHPDPVSGKPAASGLLETTQLLKIAAAVLAPVFASLLGEVIKLPSF